MKNLKYLKLLFTVLLTTAFIYGCKEDSVSTIPDNLDLSTVSTADSIGDASGILILDTVKILIKDIKLNVSNNNQDTNNFKVGPYVLYLNLNSNVNIISSGFIPAGTYDKVRFMVHKVENNEPVPDPDFEDVNGRYSAVVKGSFNGIPFIFKSDKSAHQKLSFTNSLQVSESGKSNITLKVLPYLWFIKNNTYLDPSDPANHSDIENNIKENINNNFKIFVDNDRNGIPD